MFKRQQPAPNPNPNPTPSENQNDGAVGFSANEEAPIKKRRGRVPGSVAPAKQTEALGKIKTTLQMIFGAASGMAIAVGVSTQNNALQRDGNILSPAHKATDNLIDAILVLCQQDKAVREFFLAITTGSAYTNVVVASLPVVIAILANHNLIPPIFGTPAAIPEPNPNAQN